MSIDMSERTHSEISRPDVDITAFTEFVQLDATEQDFSSSLCKLEPEIAAAVVVRRIAQARGLHNQQAADIAGIKGVLVANRDELVGDITCIEKAANAEARPLENEMAKIAALIVKLEDQRGQLEEQVSAIESAAQAQIVAIRPDLIPIYDLLGSVEAVISSELDQTGKWDEIEQKAEQLRNELNNLLNLRRSAFKRYEACERDKYQKEYIRIDAEGELRPVQEALDAFKSANYAAQTRAHDAAISELERTGQDAEQYDIAQINFEGTLAHSTFQLDPRYKALEAELSDKRDALRAAEAAFEASERATREAFGVVYEIDRKIKELHEEVIKVSRRASALKGVYTRVVSGPGNELKTQAQGLMESLSEKYALGKMVNSSENDKESSPVPHGNVQLSNPPVLEGTVLEVAAKRTYTFGTGIQLERTVAETGELSDDRND